MRITSVTLPPPARHHQLFRHGRDLGFTQADAAAGEKGFWTDEGLFVGLEQAVEIAERAGQRLRVTGPAEILMSEDVW